MSSRLEELAWSATAMGELSLRRRRDPLSGTDVYEVKLGEEFLMSSLFTVAEVAMARLALGGLRGTGLTVAVGGLGLGFTADAVLRDERVAQLVVVEALEPVIDWHRRGLVPLGSVLTADVRCRLVPGDFFAMNAGTGFDPDRPDRLFDAVLVDIDHSPRHRLDGRVDDFYGVEGTRRLAAHLQPAGVFALWSNDPPDAGYLSVLEEVFDDVVAEVVSFWNPLQEREAANTVYLGTAPAEAPGSGTIASCAGPGHDRNLPPPHRPSG